MLILLRKQLKKSVIGLVLFLSFCAPVFSSWAASEVAVTYKKEDILVQNANRYYPAKPIFDKFGITLEQKTEEDQNKLLLKEKNKTYQVVLDDKKKLAYTKAGSYGYLSYNNHLYFTKNFYEAILKNSDTSWIGKNNTLKLYDNAPTGLVLENLDEHKEAKAPVVTKTEAPVPSVKAAVTSNVVAAKPAVTPVKAVATPAKAVAKTQAAPTTVKSTQRGQASWYGAALHGNLTASGERFDMNALTAAHNGLPFGTRVKVTNLTNGLSVIVRITDRGELAPGRIIDLSYAAAGKIDMISAGVADVQLDVLS